MIINFKSLTFSVKAFSLTDGSLEFCPQNWSLTSRITYINCYTVIWILGMKGFYRCLPFFFDKNGFRK